MRRAFVFGAEKSARHLIGAIVFGCLGGAAAVACSSPSNAPPNCTATAGCGVLVEDGGDDASDATMTADHHVAMTPDANGDGSGDATGDVTADVTVDSPHEAMADVAAEAAAEAGATDGSASDAPADVANDTCAGTFCSGVCTHTGTDPNNCGTCNNVCGMGGTCSGGSCVCTTPAVNCPNQCVNMTNDTNNCGACSHNCQGNSCANSLCVPSQVASGGQYLQQVQVDQTNVYWTNQGNGAGVYTTALSGGNPITIGVDFSPVALVLGNGNLYWADSATGTIYEVPTSIATTSSSNAQLSTTTLVVGPDAGAPWFVTSLAVDANNIYWTAFGTGVVYEAPLSGGSPVPVATNQGRPFSVGIDSTYVYWINQGTGGSTGSIARAPIVPVDGGAPTTMAQGLASPETLAVDNNNNQIYWTSKVNSTGAVYALPKSAAVPDGGSGPTPTTIASGQGSPWGLVFDSQYIYWTNSANNTVSKAPLPSPDGGTGSVSLFAQGQSNPQAMALDQSGSSANGNSIYWINFGTAQIVKDTK